MREPFGTDLASMEPGEVARVIEETPEKELQEALRGTIRDAVLGEVFRRFPEYLDRSATRGRRAVIEWAIGGGKRGRSDRYLVVIDKGTCRAGKGLDAKPDLTLELGTLDFLRLVTGGANVPVMFVTGALRVQGDDKLALDVARFFRFPGPNGNVNGFEVDPTSVDAVALAREIKTTSDDRLREGLRGPFRSMVLDEIFRRFPEYFDAQKGGRANGLVKFRITGGPAKEPDRYLVRLAGGKCKTGARLQGDPRATLTIDGVTFLKLVTGNVNPTVDFMKRRIRVRGDLMFAAGLPGLFRIPSPDD